MMAEINLVQAVNLALARAMAEDNKVLVLGEDVAAEGGVFRATDGLLTRFGGDRIFDTPLAENAIAGLSVGLAAQGFRPVAEIQFTGFIYPAIDQLVNHASRLRTRTRGRLTCPMVVRSPAGGGIHAIEHHSESPEAMFAHIPGLRVVIPSSPARAYGLLLAAIHDPDPVVFLEPTRLYRAAREEVEDDGAALPLDRCFVLREGNDIIAVREAVARAVAKARAGGGPHLIEALTYRLSDHTTADDARRYRSDADVSPHWAEDPITRLRNHLVGLSQWAKADEEGLLAEVSAAVDKAAETYLATPPQDPATIFDFTYETLPKDLVEQRQGLDPARE